jgi:DNA adenine methylase
MVKPILKWAGGKRQLLDEIYSRFPQSYNQYHEPMIGGGAVFFDLEPENGSINDTNSKLVNFYKQVRERPNELIEECKSFEHPESEPDLSREFSDKDRKGKEVGDYYYQQRAIFNRRPHDEEYDKLEEAALLLYLNRTCYNGLYRENSDGAFNVPIGRYTNPDWVREEQIRKCSRVLEGTEIRNRDFEYILDVVKEDDLVYIDPPYEPMSSTAYFTNYSKEGFDKDDQERLFEVVKGLDDRGVFFILSNSGVMYEMYDEAGIYVETEGATRSINSDETNRGEVEEIIATNVEPDDRRKVGQKGITEF